LQQESVAENAGTAAIAAVTVPPAAVTVTPNVATKKVIARYFELNKISCDN